MTKTEKKTVKKTLKTKKKVGRHGKYTPETIEKICRVIAEGGTEKMAYMAGGISEALYYKWKSEKVEFLESIEKAKIQYQEWLDKECLKEAEKGLMRLIRGEEYTETTTEFGLDKNGNPIQTKQKQVVKRVLPNPTAIIFALCNRDPERWKNRVSNEVSGKITTETKNSVSLASVPDDLLGQVIDAINNGK